MRGERLQSSNFYHGQTIRVVGHVLDNEEALQMGFKLESGLDGMQPVAIGYDSENNVTGIVPMVLTNQEADNSKIDIKHYREMLSEIAKTGKPQFGL